MSAYGMQELRNLFLAKRTVEKNKWLNKSKFSNDKFKGQKVGK